MEASAPTTTLASDAAVVGDNTCAAGCTAVGGGGGSGAGAGVATREKAQGLLPPRPPLPPPPVGVEGADPAEVKAVHAALCRRSSTLAPLPRDARRKSAPSLHTAQGAAAEDLADWVRCKLRRLPPRKKYSE